MAEWDGGSWCPNGGCPMSTPSLPERNEDGIRPAIPTAQAVVARWLIRARRSRALSRCQLAERAGVSVETVARIESGRHTPRAATVRKLEAVLDQG